MKKYYSAKLKQHLRLGLLLFFFTPALLAEESLDDVRALKESNAIQLALQLMDEHQPDPQTDLEKWMAWENERLRIYEQTANWLALIERTNEFPSNLTSQFLISAKMLRARAFLENKQPHAARQVLQGLVWLSPSLTREENQQWLPLWRHQIIISYLDQNL